jgi:hypothetical protein
LLIQLKNHLRASEKAAQKVKIKETTWKMFCKTIMRNFFLNSWKKRDFHVIFFHHNEKFLYYYFCKEFHHFL